MATILSVNAAHDDGEFPSLTSEQGDRIAAALLRTPVIGQATWHDGPRQARCRGSRGHHHGRCADSKTERPGRSRRGISRKLVDLEVS
jgi:hypothetical protein